MTVSRRIVLRFSKQLVEKPIVARLIRNYNLDFNILKASITPDEEGLLILGLSGKRSEYEKGINYLKQTGVSVQMLSQDVVMNEKRCTHCGACVTVCPTEAFVVDKKDKKVKFYNEKCIACGICIKACPPRAMDVHF